MLRFLPDSALEGLLRPLLMIDPVVGLYLENAAPDWRFAAFFVLLAVVVLHPRVPRLSTGLKVAALGTVALFYVWTFVSGNGRYFSWALLVVGPLLVAVCMLLPCSRSLRWSLLALLMSLQMTALYMERTPNPWALVKAGDATLELAASPVREQPAVFLTISLISYSILVPQFHPQSRWANIAGQYNLLPDKPEWARLQALLRSPLPKYLVAAVRPEDQDAGGQPYGGTLKALQEVLAPQGLGLAAGGCQTLGSPQSGPVEPTDTPAQRARRGFWVCALEPRSGASPAQAPLHAGPDGHRQAMDAVEQRCPRFFPPGGGQPALLQGAQLRKYAASDVRLWVMPEGVVMYQYYRAMNPTQVGSVEDVIAGRFTLACDKLPGRYLPFWQRP
jgi:hypothetical protein